MHALRSLAVFPVATMARRPKNMTRKITEIMREAGADWARRQAGESGKNRNRAFIARARQRADSPLVCEYCGLRVVICGSGSHCHRFNPTTPSAAKETE